LATLLEGDGVTVIVEVNEFVDVSAQVVVALELSRTVTVPVVWTTASVSEVAPLAIVADVPSAKVTVKGPFVSFRAVTVTLLTWDVTCPATAATGVPVAVQANVPAVFVLEHEARKTENTINAKA
jgi:hypothetical protein